MVSEYMRFDCIRYVADYYYKSEMLREYEQTLADLDGIKGIEQHEKVQSSGLSDTTSQIALQRVRLSETIQDCKDHIKSFERAIESLTADEKLAIKLFFGSHLQSPVEEFEKRGISKTAAYEKRHSALQKIERSLLG